MWSSFTKWCGIIIVSKMLHGKGKIIYVRFIPPFMKNGRSFESRGEISIRGRGCNTLGIRLTLLHLHYMSWSNIHFIKTTHMKYTICCIVSKTCFMQYKLMNGWMMLMFMKCKCNYASLTPRVLQPSPLIKISPWDLKSVPFWIKGRVYILQIIFPFPRCIAFTTPGYST